MSSFDATGTHTRVVIVGAGFGGLTAAKCMAKTPLDVTIVDQHNYHLFQPLLYQVATASLSPADIASPIRGILRNVDNVKIILAKVSGVDVARREVLAEGRRIPFDDLIIATGAGMPISTTTGRSSHPASRPSTTPFISAAGSCSPSSAPRPSRTRTSGGGC